MKLVVNRIVCKNGLTLSVQASRTHYCTPREDKGPYTTVEVGYPNMVVAELLEYAEDKDKPMETVYGYVPVQVVQKVIDSAGGLSVANFL